MRNEEGVSGIEDVKKYEELRENRDNYCGRLGIGRRGRGVWGGGILMLLFDKGGHTHFGPRGRKRPTSWRGGVEIKHTRSSTDHSMSFSC